MAPGACPAAHSSSSGRRAGTSRRAGSGGARGRRRVRSCSWADPCRFGGVRVHGRVSRDAGGGSAVMLDGGGMGGGPGLVAADEIRHVGEAVGPVAPTRRCSIGTPRRSGRPSGFADRARPGGPPAAGSWMWRAPGIMPPATSPGLRTSTICRAGTREVASSSWVTVRREATWTSSGRAAMAASGSRSAPMTVSKPMRARRVRASSSAPSGVTRTIGVPAATTSPTYSAKRPESPTFSEPRRCPRRTTPRRGHRRSPRRRLAHGAPRRR